MLLVVPQAGGHAQGQRSRGSIQPYKNGTQASPCPLMASYSDIVLAHGTILISPVFGRINDYVMSQKDVCICTSDKP